MEWVDLVSDLDAGGFGFEFGGYLDDENVLFFLI